MLEIALRIVRLARLMGPLPALHLLGALLRALTALSRLARASPIAYRSAAVRRNLRQAFSDRTWTFRRALAEDEERQVARKIVEEIALLGMPAEPFIEYIRSRTRIDGLEHLERALRAGKGAILCTCHLGAIALVPAILVVQLPELFRAHPFVYANKRVGGTTREAIRDRIAEAARRYGAHVQEVGVEERFLSARTMARALEHGAILYLAADGDLFGPGRRRSPHRITIFGHTIRVGGGAAWLALRTGAALLPAYCLRERADRAALHILPPLEAPPGAGVADLTERIFLAHRERLERYPAQFLFWDRLDRLAVERAMPWGGLPAQGPGLAASAIS